MVLTQVNNCPSTFSKWRNSSKECPNTDYYHCVLDENSNFVQGCIKPIWIETEFCPVYNTKAVKMDSQKCKRKECPTSNFRSFQIYQYPECLSRERLILESTTESDISLSATQTLTENGSSRPLAYIQP
ncbi:uncharacterized protein LOC134228867 [Saccostrea cucullata]|uniref:uncharacterized protein LOC134228867 n=1 Tax=Saccostrea cuccullata TaxID=36930 RepID=UPI002ED60F39